MSGCEVLDEERLAARALALLSRPGAWISAEADGYRVRLGPDRRLRAPLALDEAGFRRLAQAPGLAVRPEGGWRLAHAAEPEARDAAGRPGVALGERLVTEENGRTAVRRANLAESPLGWLARRRDAQGRPWLTAVEAAAGERLREEFQRAGAIGRLTMSWDAAPRSRSARGPGADPLARGHAARARVAAALDAVGPELRRVLEQVCLRETSLSLAERDLALPRGAGKAVLKLALQRLAAHYRMG